MCANEMAFDNLLPHAGGGDWKMVEIFRSFSVTCNLSGIDSRGAGLTLMLERGTVWIYQTVLKVQDADRSDHYYPFRIVVLG